MNSFITFAGTPAANVFAGTSFTTQAQAATTLPSPMHVFPRTAALAPIQTPRPTVIAYFFSGACAALRSADLVPAREEGHIRRNIAVVANRDRSVSVNGQAVSDPAIRANVKRPCVVDWPNDPGIFSDLIADGAEKPSFRGKETRSFQDMINDVNHDSFLAVLSFMACTNPPAEALPDCTGHPQTAARHPPRSGASVIAARAASRQSLHSIAL